MHVCSSRRRGNIHVGTEQLRIHYTEPCFQPKRLPKEWIKDDITDSIKENQVSSAKGYHNLDISQKPTPYCTLQQGERLCHGTKGVQQTKRMCQRNQPHLQVCSLPQMSLRRFLAGEWVPLCNWGQGRRGCVSPM